MRKRLEDPAGALPGLVEVRRADDVHVEASRAGRRPPAPDGLQDVEGQRVPGLEVAVQDAKAWVEP